jgi:hypothetical protein
MAGGPGLNILGNVTAGYRSGRSGGGGLSVRLSPSWRTAAGTFLQPPLRGAIDRGLYDLGTAAVRRLANATPVRTGRMRAGWRSTLVPTRSQMRITNLAPYAGYVTGGTRYQRANPDLQRVITQELPRMARVTGNTALADISVALKG